MERVTPRVLISVCVAIALIVTVSVFAFGKRNGQNDKMALAAGVSATSTSDPASTPSPTTAPPLDPATTTIKQGMSDPVVITIQQRLMDLNYMDDMEPTQLYGPLTKQAVELFQRQEGIAVDGCIGASTYSMLMAQNAPKYTVSEGAQGTDVKELETRLYELGYLDAASDKFTADTKTAVQKFQQLNGLAADGAIGENTMEMLYSDDVKPNIYMNGDQSQKILGYQKRLQSLGYLTTAPDGTYGTDTVNAIKRFQDQKRPDRRRLSRPADNIGAQFQRRAEQRAYPRDERQRCDKGPAEAYHPEIYEQRNGLLRLGHRERRNGFPETEWLKAGWKSRPADPEHSYVDKSKGGAGPDKRKHEKEYYHR